MSRNSKKNPANAEPRAPQSPPEPQAGRSGRRGIVFAAGVGLLLAGVAGTLIYKGSGGAASSAAAAANRPGLASGHSPSLSRSEC